MSRTANIAAFAAAILLAVVGIIVLIADVIQGGELHVMNAVIGGSALAVAVAIALPVRLREALAELIPALQAARKSQS